MRLRSILLALLAIPAMASAATYYVSPNGSDTNNGTSIATAWRTIARVNQLGSALTAGDQVLFERGGVYRGRIDVTRSGTAAAKITFGAYGSGDAPVISGSTVPTGWTVHSGNIWKATVSGTVRNVFFNGQMLTLARFPNSGWLRTNSGTSTTTTDTELTQPNGYWNGATMVLRTTLWSYDTAFVTAHSGSTLTHTATGNDLGTRQWGFFFQNKLALLDQAGEWFHDRASNTLYVWLPGNASPATGLLEACTQDFGIYTSYQRAYVVVRDLAFRHQTDCSIRLSGTTNIEVRDCQISDTQRAIYSTGSTQNIHHNTISRTWTSALYLLDNNTLLTDNTLTDICIWPGLGEKDWGYFGIRTTGTGMVIRNNRLDRIGYIGIVTSGNALVEQNVLSNCLLILNDGGGIAFDNSDGLIVRENIVRDVVGDIESVAPEWPNYFPMAHGIYFGNTSNKNVTVERNTVMNCSRTGIHVDHTMVSSGNIVRDNTLWNNGDAQLSLSDYSNYNTPGATAPFYVASYNTVYSGNIMYCLNREQHCMKHTNVYGTTPVDFGSFSGNYYFNPYDELSIQIDVNPLGAKTVYTLEWWRSQFNKDLNSVRSPLRQDFYSTLGELSSNLVTNGTFDSNVTGWAATPSAMPLARDLTYLDNGAMRLTIPTGTQGTNYIVRSTNQFAMQNGQWYRLRFSLQSAQSGIINVGVKGVSQLTGPNALLARDLPHDSQRRDMEWYFQSALGENALVQLLHTQTNMQYWADNIQLHRVSVAPSPATDNHLIYWNEQSTAQSFTLPAGCWRDVTGAAQGPTVTVQPFRSLVVYRVTGTGCSTPTVDCAGTAGGSALPGTACNDGNPCTINDAYDANCQCVGSSAAVVPVVAAGGATAICSGGSVVLSATTGTGYSYQWKRDGTAISGATASSYTATAAGTYTVDLTSNGCTSTSTGLAVTVSALPAATITAGGTTALCSGASVTLTASSGTGYTYQWRNNGTSISGATASTYTATAAGSYSVVVTSGGCSATSAATAVSVTAAPSATITAGGATSFCSGGSVVLSANTGTGLSYQWRNNGVNIAGATASTFTATASGSYTVVVTSGSCSTTSAAIAVTVSSLPAAAITAGGATTFCGGGSVTLNANTGTGLTYQWRNNGTAISGATASSYTATAGGSYTVVVSNGGCSATSAATAVTVTAAPSATITAGGSTSFCTGGSVVLSASTGTGYTYQWRNNGTAITGATTATYTAITSGSYTVAVTSGGCTSVSAGLSVTASAAPAAAITAGGATSFCSGGSVLLSASTGTGYTYQWQNNGTAISGATASTYSATATGSYSVVVTNGGCTATSAATSVTVSASPTASITTGGATSFCSGGSVVLSASTGTGYAYQWRNNGTAIAGATAASYTASTSGSYTVSVTSSSCTATSSATTVTVSSVPVATITAGGSTAFCDGGSVVLSAPTGTGLTYQWRKDGASISGATASSYTATTAGSYTVVVANGVCSTTSGATAVTVKAAPVVSCSASASTSTVSVAATGGQSPYTYSWNTSPVQTTATATVAASGTYTATVTGGNGCSSSCSATISLANSTACTGIRTEAQGTWGATATATNAAGIMTSNWAAAFPAPTYLTVGCGSRLMRFTSAQSVINSLPTYGTPALVPTGTTVDPGTSVANTLVGQIAALQLNIRIDELVPSFSPSSLLLKNMVVASGTFAGLTVQQLLDLANQHAGGCASTYPLATISTALTNLNNGYQAATMNNGFLTCPTGMVLEGAGSAAQDAPMAEGPRVSVYPNPFREATTIWFRNLAAGERLTVRILSIEGAVVAELHDAAVPEEGSVRVEWDAAQQASGMYFYQAVNGTAMATGKLLVE